MSEIENIYLRAQRVAAVLRRATQRSFDSDRQKMEALSAANVAAIHRIEGRLSRKGQR